METEDKKEALKAVMSYLNGTRESSKDKLESAFYSSVNLHSVDNDGRLEMVARDRFIAFASAGKLPEHTNEVLSLDIIGDLAWATVKFDLPDREFFDVLTLLKLKTGWVIVSKTYTTISKK